MKRFKVLTILTLFGITAGQPVQNKPTEKVKPVNSEEMLKLLRSSVEKSAHTYGMNLNSNIGYVWNNIGHRTPIIHHVGKEEQQPNNGGNQKQNTTLKNPPQILEELFNYEDFWIWLSDWTTMYMQALSEYLSNVIKEEVAREVQMYFNILETGDYLKKMDRVNTDRVRNQLYLEVKHKLIEEGLIDYNKNKTNAIGDMKNEIHRIVIEQFEAMKKRPDKDEKKPDKDDKRNHNDKFRVEADKIFGNSLGNDKVINIYIFNPKDSDQVIEQLKPITDGVSTGTFTVGAQETVVVGDNTENTPDSLVIEAERF